MSRSRFSGGLLVLVLLMLVAASGADARKPGASGKRHRAVCSVAAPGQARCMAEVVVDDATGDAVAQAAPFGFGPADLASAYALPSATAGAGQTVAIVDAYNNPNAEADLATYRAQYGLPACTTANGCFKKVNQTGGTSYPAANVGWAQEIALDVDAVSATCPNCHILLVEANDASFSNLGVAVDYAASHATVISNSYGGDEFAGETTSTYDGHYNHPGIPITVSTGDSGYGVQYPAASSHVTAVGGTALGKYIGSPRGWNETAWTGAGSGCSAYVAKPAWQHDTGCARRTVADVSAVADPDTGIAVYDTYGSGGWLVFGGTSLSAPIVAGVYALIGTTGSSAYGSYFYGQPGSIFDVVAGSNGVCSPQYLCTGLAGFDGPTGLGTPNLAGTTVPPVTGPAAVTGAASSITTGSATIGGTVSPNGAATSYHFEYGPTPSYTSSTTSASAGSGSTAVAESAVLTGLSPSTTYHFRIVATNSNGTSNGLDGSFTTAASPSSTFSFPSSVSITSGSLGSGSAGNLAAADGSFYNVLSTTGRKPVAQWSGVMSGVPNTLSSLSVTFTGKSTAACTQAVAILNTSTGAWKLLDSRAASTGTPGTVTTALAGRLTNFVSGSSGSGNVQLRVTCTGTAGQAQFTDQADLLKVSWSV
jgi:subtilase family serine protease